ncbi:suppressor of fused domain protein [uncultured Deinococcus sp.]|uniref:suppressor of fused domain protein n=1 Tax=uncultured Deinococcus sp. TaxID=158789 RepID=UPI0025ED8A42|nr:suppressor of fused domain protein [uncultured Deinococcus sp.]
MDDEKTRGGQPIYRYSTNERGWVVPKIDAEIKGAVEAHLTRFLGHDSIVWHEIISDLVHIDVYKFDPTPQRPYYTLVTSGMSDRPMTVPEKLEEMQRAELLICLPPDWPLGKAGESTSEGDLGDFNNYWPIHMLKYLARMPHEYRTWLGWGHSIPNGEPPAAFADTNFVGSVVGPVVTLPDEFVKLDVGDSTVWFYAIYPVYAEELQFKIDNSGGADALFGRFEKAGVTELVDPLRKNVCAKRKFGRFFS